MKTTTRICPNCREENPRGSRHCVRCGSSLEVDDATIESLKSQEERMHRKASRKKGWICVLLAVIFFAIFYAIYVTTAVNDVILVLLLAVALACLAGGLIYLLTGRRTDDKGARGLKEVLKKVVIVAMCLLVAFALWSFVLSAPPEARSGSWHASTPYGDFRFYVSEDGSAITGVDYDFECKGTRASSSNRSFREPIPIRGRKLSMWTSAGFIKMASWKATFSPNGKRLTGTVTFVPDEISGGCEAHFTATK